MFETGVPFNVRDFVEALQEIYKHTHPPDGLQEEVVEV